MSVRDLKENILIPAECCPSDKEVVREGSPECQHEFPKKPNFERDICVHFICAKCGREICYGIWD